MKRILFAGILIIAAAGANAQCSELFISEYVEGWSNNKAIEIYNPTNQVKSLSNYRLERFSNGSANAAPNQQLVLSGEIEPYSTFVVVIDKRDSTGEGQEAPVWDELQEKADLFAGPVYDENNTMYFNGNDAIVFRNITNGGGFVIDVIGRAGENPDVEGDDFGVGGWNNVGPSFTFAANGSESWTTDHSLVRKADVTIGDPNGNNPFDPSVQWDSIPPVILNDEGNLVGNWESLGNHTCVCNPLNTADAAVINAVLYPNPASAQERVWFESEVTMVRYEIFDITGKLIASEAVNGQQRFDVEIAGLKKGIYFFKTFDGHTYYAKKLVVS